MVMIKEWFTVQEAAEYLCISKRTIYKLTKEGRLPTFRLGLERHRRFRKQDLDALPRALPENQVEQAPALNARDDPILATIWNNDQDAIYDRL